MLTTSQVLVLTSFFALAAAACRDAAPRHVDAEMVLETVAGQAPPAIVSQGEFATMTVIADTIRLYADGTGRRILVMDVEDDILEVPDPGPRRRTETAFTYTLVGERFELAFHCPDLALCIAPPHLAGELAGNTLTVTLLPSWQRFPLVYSVRGMVRRSQTGD